MNWCLLYSIDSRTSSLDEIDERNLDGDAGDATVMELHKEFLKTYEKVRNTRGKCI